MSTTIRDPQGTLLWQPNDFGVYSVMKTDAIAKIIADLVTDTKIKVESYIADDDAALANVYSRTQADERFVQLASFDSYLEGQLYRFIVSGEIVGSDAIDLINSRLLLLYRSCFGTDLDGTHVQVGFDSRIQSLEDTSDFMYDRVTRISRDIYLIRDGEVDVNVLVIAKLADTGLKENLSPTIADTSTMVAAINSVNSSLLDLSDSVDGISSRVGNLETQNGNEHLTTTAQTLSGAVNEINSSLGSTSTLANNLDTEIGNMNSLDSGFSNREVVAALNQLIGSINTLSGQISSLNDRVTALES